MRIGWAQWVPKSFLTSPVASKLVPCDRKATTNSINDKTQINLKPVIYLFTRLSKRKSLGVASLPRKNLFSTETTTAVLSVLRLWPIRHRGVYRNNTISYLYAAWFFSPARGGRRRTTTHISDRCFCITFSIERYTPIKQGNLSNICENLRVKIKQKYENNKGAKTN